jgi:hypothetical protein
VDLTMRVKYRTRQHASLRLRAKSCVGRTPIENKIDMRKIPYGGFEKCLVWCKHATEHEMPNHGKL